MRHLMMGSRGFLHLSRGSLGLHASRFSRCAQTAKNQGDGISHQIEYNGVVQQVLTFPKRRPFATNIIIATSKTSLADILVQIGEGKRDWREINWQRNAVFVAFGCFYLGAVQWFVYVTLFTKLCTNAIR